MRKTPLPPRRTRLRRSLTPLARGPVRPANPTRKARKKARYKAFLSSAVWKRIRKEALARAGHRCEETQLWLSPRTMRQITVRCHETERLTVHHLSYTRFGGEELPGDLVVLCKACHDRLHAIAGKRIA